MKFGEVTPKDAVGAVLAHSVSCGSKRLKKGAALSQASAVVPPFEGGKRG